MSQSGGQLVKIHDDGQLEVTIVVHGFSPRSFYPDFELLKWSINEAEIRGRVYLYYWESGPLHRFFQAKSRADCLGASLYYALSHCKDIGSLPITLIGYSLGSRLLAGFLDYIPNFTFKIRSVVLLGGAADNDDDVDNRHDWDKRARLVSGEIINVYTRTDRELTRYRHIVGDPVGVNPITSRLLKIRNVHWPWDHDDYFEQFDLALFKALPTRRRSVNFNGEVLIKCPGKDCEERLIVKANTESYCKDCRIEFRYDPRTKKRIVIRQ